MIANADAPVRRSGGLSKELTGGLRRRLGYLSDRDERDPRDQVQDRGGYTGHREAHLAMERGEVQGIGGITWASVKATMGEALATKRMVWSRSTG